MTQPSDVTSAYTEGTLKLYTLISQHYLYYSLCLISLSRFPGLSNKLCDDFILILLVGILNSHRCFPLVIEIKVSCILCFTELLNMVLRLVALE